GSCGGARRCAGRGPPAEAAEAAEAGAAPPPAEAEACGVRQRCGLAAKRGSLGVGGGAQTTLSGSARTACPAAGARPKYNQAFRNCRTTVAIDTSGCQTPLEYRWGVQQPAAAKGRGPLADDGQQPAHRLSTDRRLPGRPHHDRDTMDRKSLRHLHRLRQWSTDRSKARMCPTRKGATTYRPAAADCFFS
ncbi:unnamed protein product, partial [Prorocentrum cordatum]